jgi:hypothetical protein
MKSKAISVACGLVIACVSGVILPLAVASGQEPESAPKAEDESQESANKRHLAEMRMLADTIQVTVGEGEHRKEAKLIEKPLFRFSDPSRLHSDGSVWAWAIAGRPVMMAEFRTADRSKRAWGHDLVATSDVRVSAAVGGHGIWAPREPQFQLLPVPDARPPAKTQVARLRQMKQFARRLNASQVWQGQRAELRLLPTEIHRYSDAKTGLLDAAAFAFVVGNNPEAILFVEAHQADGGPDGLGSWKYGLARMSAAEVTFVLDQTEVWTVPQSFGSSNAAYYCFTRPIETVRTSNADVRKEIQ